MERWRQKGNYGIKSKSANDQTSFIIKKPNIRTERNGSCGIMLMERREKEEKKQVGETERTRKRHHTQHTKE